MLHPAVREALDRLSHPYEALPCDPELADTAAFCAHYGFPPENAGNAILVAAKTESPRFALCVVLATTKLDVNHTVRKLLDARKASFADAETTRRVTGMMIGGVTPFGLSPGVPIYIDSRIPSLPYVILGGGNRSSKIKAAPDLLSRLPGARLIEGLAK